MNIINNAAWKKCEEIKKDVNKGRKVKRKRGIGNEVGREKEGRK
jgi:hypothetical protein